MEKGRGISPLVKVYESPEAGKPLGKYAIGFENEEPYVCKGAEIVPLLPNTGPRLGSYYLKNPHDAKKLKESAQINH